MRPDYDEIAEKILQADAILINGLSITEGLNLFADDESFENLFGDYKKKYGIRRILDGYFYPWKTAEEKWGFLSRLIDHYSGNYKTSPVMENLKEIVGDKSYFVLTSNGERHFELAGFEPEKVYELEGNWLEMRCSGLCHQKKLVILELGIGWRNQLIKAPLMRITADEPFTTYITINLGEVYIPEKIENKSYGLDGYLSEQLQYIKEAIEKRSSADDGKLGI